MSNKIELKSIGELEGMNFFIPGYQRGYRWAKQQVKDLLDDIQEFIKKNHDGFYSIQPLVIRESMLKSDEVTFKQQLEEIKLDSDLLTATKKLLSNYTKWEVIDGQQRLTTIYILLNYLGKVNEYTVEYETRPGSRDFLLKIDESLKENNIDYYHIVEAKKQIDDWFSDNKNDKSKFLETLLEDVKFIWYESVDENPIKVFTRLNIGKIALTNAELIKALFLNKSNFKVSDYQKVRLQQQEIATEWDTIEYTLQNDEFWLFLNAANYDKPTRIDFIFDLICEKDILGLQNFLNLDDTKYNKKLGSDKDRTFRYFYAWFKKEDEVDIALCWKEVKTIFQIFQEWYYDLELYHYIGFLVVQGYEISSIIEKWREEQTKEFFISEYIHFTIKESIGNTYAENLMKLRYNDKYLSSILLLHNIQSIINQNENLKENEKFKLPVFYKFPFHLYKKEKHNGGWDVEHIDSHTENQLDKVIERKEWLKYSSMGIELHTELKDKILKYVSATKDNERPEFDELYAEIVNSYIQDGEDKNKLTDEEKNYIWNLTLLDSSTNRGYGNSIFPAKRRVIIGKDQGKVITVDNDLNVTESDGAIAFIPPCTKNVFLKYFNSSTNNLREWDRKDAEAYLNNIKTVLHDFLA